MGLLNPAIVQALLGTAEGRANRRQQRRLARRPSFGTIASESLAGSLGAVPGQAAGAFIGGEIGRANQMSLMAEEEKLRTARTADERAYQDAVVPVPGTDRTAPRWARSTILEDALSRVPKPLGPDEMMPVLPGDRGPGSWAEGIPEPLTGGPEGILNQPFSALSPEILAAVNEASGARATVPIKEAEFRQKRVGDLATVADKARQRKIEEGKLAETERYHRETASVARDAIAQRGRAAAIRQQLGLDSLSMDRLVAQMKEAGTMVRDVEDRLEKARFDIYQSPDDKTAVLELLNREASAARDKYNAHINALENRGSTAVPAPAAPAPTDDATFIQQMKAKRAAGQSLTPEERQRVVGITQR